MEASDETGGAGRTLAVTLGLLVLVAVLAALVRSAFATRAVPADQALADWIEPGPLPFGLVPERAVRQGGELLVSYVNPEAPAEAAKLEQPERKKPARGKKQEPEPFDWSAIEIGPAGQPPVELLAVRYGKDAAKRIEKLFEPPRTEDGETPEIETFDAEGGRALMDRGRVRWGDYEVLFAQRRELERGGTFRDVMQVNLTLPGRPLVLYARWPRGLPASSERLVELLAALRPTP